MAIVRTTKETNIGGTAPPTPADKTKSVVAKTSVRTPARQPVRRPVVAPGQQAQARRSGKDFLLDTWAELHRVVWPTWREVEAGTIVTIGLLVFFAAYIFVLDIAAKWVLTGIGLPFKGTS